MLKKTWWTDGECISNWLSRNTFSILLLESFPVILRLSCSWGEAGHGSLLRETQQTGEGPPGFRSSPGAEFKVRWSSGWPGRFGAQQQGSWFHQKWSAAPVPSLHHRPQQPHGAQPPGQSLLLQKGVVTLKVHIEIAVSFHLSSQQCAYLLTLRITAKCSIWLYMRSTTPRWRPCRLRAATS